MTLMLSDPVVVDDVEVTSRDINQWFSRHPDLKPFRSDAAVINRAFSEIRRAKKLKKAPKGKEITAASADAPWRVIYGYARVPGVISFLHASSPSGESGNDKTWFHIVCTLAGHEIQGVDGIYLDGNLITFGADGWSTGPTVDEKVYAGRVYREVKTGAAGESNFSYLSSLQPTYWTANHRQSGRAKVHLIIVWDPVTFPGSLPQIEFLVSGKKVYDPLVGYSYFSNLAPLVIADFLTDSTIGLGYSWDEINTSSLQTATVRCGEDVPTRSGATEKRYTIDGSFQLSEQPRSILEEFEQAMAGKIRWFNGQWHFLPGVWTDPISVSLTEEDLRSEVEIETTIPIDDSFNSFRGQYIEPNKKHEVSDFPALSVSAYVSADNNNVKWQDFTFNFTQSPSRAQRIARIELERVRRPILLRADWSLKAFPLELGDIVYVTLSRYGFSAKTFEVIDYALSDPSNLDVIVSLELKESDGYIYSWNPALNEQEVHTALVTTLPSPSQVGIVSGITLASGNEWLDIRSDGTVFSRLHISWTAPTDAFVRSGGNIRIQYKKTSSSTWQDAVTVPGDVTAANILDVEDLVSYDVRLQCVNILGIAGAWLQGPSHVVLGKSALPSNVLDLTGTISFDGIVLTWPAIEDKDLAFYEIRQGSTWSTATLIAQYNGTRYNVPQVTAGTYKYLVSARDTSGNYSATPATLDVTLNGPSIDNGAVTFEGSAIRLSWRQYAGHFGINNYSIYYGDTWATATLFTTTKSTSLVIPVTWTGNRKFWIQAGDVSGNLSTELSIDAVIVPPGAVQNLRAEVVDNNIKLKWGAPSAGSLYVDGYEIREGDAWSTAELIGVVKGTFAIVFEVSADTYTYLIAAKDSAGNYGAASQISAAMLEPPGFEVLLDMALTEGTCINCVVDNGYIIGPVNTYETYDQHFTNNSWATIQDQIDDGYELYCQPGPDYCRWEQVVDYGVLLENTVIRSAYSLESLAGSVTLSPLLAFSEDLDTWTEEEADIVFATSFRYVRQRFDVGTIPTIDKTTRRGIPGPIVVTHPEPDSTIDAEDRRQVTNTYRGP